MQEKPNISSPEAVNGKMEEADDASAEQYELQAGGKFFQDMYRYFGEKIRYQQEESQDAKDGSEFDDLNADTKQGRASVIERYEGYLDQLRMLGTKNGRMGLRKFPEDVSEALVMLAGDMTLAHDLTGHHDELKDEVLQTAGMAKKMFMTGCRNVFTNIHETEGDYIKNLADLKLKAEHIPNTGMQVVFVQAIHSLKNDWMKRKQDMVSPRLINELLLSDIDDATLRLGNLMENMSWKPNVSEEEKKILAECVKVVYELQLIRDDLAKELYGRTDVSPDEQRQMIRLRNKINEGASEERDSEKTGQMAEKKEKGAEASLEESGEFDAERIKDEKVDLSEEGVFRELYGKRSSLEELRKVVTPEMKNALLRHLLKEVDFGVEGAMRLIQKNPNTIVNRRNLTQFAGSAVQAKQACIYQKIAFVKEGVVVDVTDLATMPIVDYLRKYLGYDLSKDKKRSRVLRQYTTAFM